MDQLKKFMAPLSAEERDKFAKRCGTSRGHLQNIMYGKACAPELALLIEKESGGAVRVESLCPNVEWSYLQNRFPEPQAA